jgi:hypothetical protein
MEKNPRVGRHRDVRSSFKFDHLCISEGEITCTVNIYYDRVGQSREKNRSRNPGTALSFHAELRGYSGRISIFYIRYVISFCNIDCTRMNCISNVNCTIQYMRSTYTVISVLPRPASIYFVLSGPCLSIFALPRPFPGLFVLLGWFPPKHICTP